MDDNLDQRPSLSVTRAAARVLESGGTAALITIIEGAANVGAKLLVQTGNNPTGDLGDETLNRAVISQAAVFLDSREETHAFLVQEFAPQLSDWTKTLLLFERIQPEPRLVICGAGHVGAALAKLGDFVGYETTLIDDRPEFVTAERFLDHKKIELIAAQDWTTAVREAIGNGRGVSVAVVTRGHSQDEECMRAVVATNPDYVGLIGSKRRTSIVINRLRETGASEEQLSRIHAPIGLDIRAVTPEEVALAILAEIVAQRRGGAGGSLSAWRR
jgi:xanthine dehydrogenase accessory factor